MSEKKLPPLFTLQAFEAAARLGSFSRAADELSLTPGAVSRQIRQLEDWSMLILFERNGPRVSLTADGALLLARMSGPLSALHEAIYPPAGDLVKTLQIATLASIAKEWLIPRLPDFIEKHPDVRPIIHTDYALVRAAPRVAMVALRHGVRQDNDPGCETLFDDRLVAVIAPKLQNTLGTDAMKWPLRAMLQHITLDVQAWLAAAGLPDEFTPQGPAFNDADVLLEAAQNGLGIALTRLSIAWRRLQAGTLVLACDVVCGSPRDNLLVVREDCADLPEVRAFTNWIRQQANHWQPIQKEFDALTHPFRMGNKRG
jgi:LysR family glycine cleavage system transcriptional activator